MLDWTNGKRLIDAAQRILLTTHVRPDGDALGSELAFADLLTGLGKEVSILNSSPTPERYYFLDPAHSRVKYLPKDPLPAQQPDLFIVLDTGTWSQLAGLADYVRTLTCPKLVIDHHVTQDDLGAVRVVDVTSAATGMLVYDAYQHFGGKIPEAAAKAMFVAIAMDTGWMRHSNSSPAVFLAMAKLVECGARPNEIYRGLFEQNRVERLKLLRVLYDRIETHLEGRLAESRIYWQDIMDVHAHPMETEDFINELMTIRRVEAAALFMGQSDGGTKVSFRSRSGLDCSALAASLGGGGHKVAAGASLPQAVDAARAKVLALLKDQFAQQGG